MRVFAGYSTACTNAVMLVTSKDTAAVSGGSFVVFAATVTAFGALPLEGLALLFGVYRFMLMLMLMVMAIDGGDAKWLGKFTAQTAKAEYSRVFGRNPEAPL